MASDVPSHRLLVDKPEGALLWDTSCPRDSEEHGEPTGRQDLLPDDKVSEEEYLDSRPSRLGPTPGDIDSGVLRHLHLDHAGNARLCKETDARLIGSDVEKELAVGFEGPFNGAHPEVDDEDLEFETVSGDASSCPGSAPSRPPGTPRAARAVVRLGGEVARDRRVDRRHAGLRPPPGPDHRLRVAPTGSYR